MEDSGEVEAEEEDSEADVEVEDLEEEVAVVEGSVEAAGEEVASEEVVEEEVDSEVATDDEEGSSDDFQDVIFINCIIMYKDQDQTRTVIMLIEDQHDDVFCTDIVHACLNLGQQTRGQYLYYGHGHG